MQSHIIKSNCICIPKRNNPNLEDLGQTTPQGRPKHPLKGTTNQNEHKELAKRKQQQKAKKEKMKTETKKQRKRGRGGEEEGGR